MKKLIAFCLVAFVVSAASANLVTVTSILDSGQDLNPINGDVEELGNRMPFPVDEWIDSSWVITTDHACSLGLDNPEIPNVLVSITNRTDRWFPNLWYVADPETTLSNFDKERINNMLAFKIDRVGFNQPLVTIDSVFDPGETWSFIIDDYQNSNNLVASAFASLGVPSVGDLSSSGSIIPEPATICILGLGTLSLIRRKK